MVYHASFGDPEHVRQFLVCRVWMMQLAMKSSPLGRVFRRKIPNPQNRQIHIPLIFSPGIAVGRTDFHLCHHIARRPVVDRDLLNVFHPSETVRFSCCFSLIHDY